MLSSFRFSLGVLKFLDRSQTSREKGLWCSWIMLFLQSGQLADILVTRSERVNETFLPV